MFNINEVVAPTRRETLLNVQNILEDERKLQEAAGQCVLLDVTLMLLADNDEELKKRFDHHLSRSELLDDIKHIGNHYRIRKQLQKRRDEYAGLCR